MPITLNKDSINFGNYSISLHPNGIEIDGKFKYASNAIPSYGVQISSPISNFVAEGSTGTYTVTTEYVEDGTVLFFTILNITTNSADFSASSGSFTITSNTGTFNIGIVADSKTEGTESYTVQVRTESTSGPIVASMTTSINDTSLDLSTQAQGSVSGYTSGGNSSTPTTVNTIDKFPFASTSGATDVGDLSQVRGDVAGQSSDTFGYTSGGNLGPNFSNRIDKFSFASNANATIVGGLINSVRSTTGQSSSTSGYTSGGYVQFSRVNVIQKFPFAVDANATDVGNLTFTRERPAGQSSTTSGYTSGGLSFPPFVIHNTIDKFPFASNANATDVADLSQARSLGAGQSSTTSGYTSGGSAPDGTNTIDKFPFASSANATDVGDLTQARTHVSGQSSTESGYTSGGFIPFPASSATNRIDKFPFASNANATIVGNLTQARLSVAGQQV